MALYALQVDLDSRGRKLHSAQVMESCVKNCGVLAHEEIATKAFMEELRDLVKQSTDENIKTKVSESCHSWFPSAGPMSGSKGTTSVSSTLQRP